MKIFGLILILVVRIALCSSLYAGSDEESAASPREGESLLLAESGHTHFLPIEEDAYLAGYIQALVKANYYEFDILIYVENRDVYLYNLPKNALVRNSIMRFIGDLPEVRSVTQVDRFPEGKRIELQKLDMGPKIRGIWFPQSSVLYPPMIANPRATLFSAFFRSGDRIMGDKSIAISLGNSFPMFRWHHLFLSDGDLQIDIQGGVWSVFKMGVHRGNREISELMNTDYLVGVPLTYAFDKWAFRLRFYHISSHLGDEFLVNHPTVHRKNPSFEACDFFISHQVNDSLRLYFGPGYVLQSDHTYPLKPPLYIEYGGEVRLFGYENFYHKLYGTFFLAIYLRNWQACRWNFDGTCVGGYEWSQLQGMGRKMRICFTLHKGYSEGQFFKQRTSYFGFGVSWGF